MELSSHCYVNEKGQLMDKGITRTDVYITGIDRLKDSAPHTDALIFVANLARIQEREYKK